MTAVDYSFARPSIATLRAHNVIAVGRYVGPPSWRKTITTSEFQTLVAAGIAVWLVFERSADDSSLGFNGGVTNAQIALRYLPTGYPPNFPIYMAADQSLSGDALNTAIDYIRGASTVLGWRTGVYGEGALLTACNDAEIATFFWQSSSKSYPGNAHTLPITDIQQLVTAPFLGSDGNILVHPLPNSVTTPTEAVTPMFAPPQTRDEFNATMRYVWYTLRTDAISEQDMDAYYYCYHLPVAQQGFGGSMDLVVAKIHDTAGTHLVNHL